MAQGSGKPSRQYTFNGRRHGGSSGRAHVCVGIGAPSPSSSTGRRADSPSPRVKTRYTPDSCFSESTAVPAEPSPKPCACEGLMALQSKRDPDFDAGPRGLRAAPPTIRRFVGARHRARDGRCCREYLLIAPSVTRQRGSSW